MTPSEYASHYKKLAVTLVGHSHPTTVALTSYRLRSLNYQAGAATALFNAVRRGVDVTMTVNLVGGGSTRLRVSDTLTKSERRFESAIQRARKLPNNQADTLQITIEPPSSQGGSTQVTSMFLNEVVRGPFSGKGSPEACQIVLQLAHHFGLAPNVHEYARQNLGLDCNGFVGNYLWHIRGRRGWTNLGMGNFDLGPDAHISEYFRGKRFITKWTDITPKRLHLLGMVDATGQVIRGGPGSSAGHLAITDPNWPATGNILVVESTGAGWVGLTESLYSLRQTKTLGGKVVFDLDRSVKMGGSRYVTFAIAPVN